MIYFNDHTLLFIFGLPIALYDLVKSYEPTGGTNALSFAI